ncbi:MAG: RIP metalloprotease RseP, partial [Candidatus Neomarinimicrobiota bacterium]|nr:RIP metalloprotease RseP [Candidatus Neomarinimicrobiota bacterium]
TGDEITSINGERIYKWSDLEQILRPIPDMPIDISVRREGDILDFSFNTSYLVIPVDGDIDTIGIIGIRPEYFYSPVNLGQAIAYGYNGTINSFGLIMLTFQMLGSGQASLNDLGGPIMIGQIAGETAKAGWIPLLGFMALISINLAFLNILPVPGLDGGHIFIILIESIIKRPLSLKVRLAVQQVGMVLLLMLMVTVMFNDISRLFN